MTITEAKTLLATHGFQAVKTPDPTTITVQVPRLGKIEFAARKIEYTGPEDTTLQRAFGFLFRYQLGRRSTSTEVIEIAGKQTRVRHEYFHVFCVGSSWDDVRDKAARGEQLRIK